MNNFLETVDTLEDKLKILLERYQFLQEENDILIENLNNIQNKALSLEEELISEREKYRLLKVAKTISGSRSDSKETKQKINALIREIDKCIVKLNQ